MRPLILLAAFGLSACAYHSQPARWQPHDGPLSGPGLAILDDWLKETREGRVVVTSGWGEARRGHVSEDVAHRANIWFRRYADRDRNMVVTDEELRTALVHAARWARRR